MNARPLPAPAAALLLLLSQAALAQVPHTEMQRCRALADSTARLACYDALAAQPARTPAPPAAAATPAPTATASPAAHATEFGRASSGPDSVESVIPGAFDGWAASKRFKLANGQVWQVADGSSAFYNLRDVKVRVKRGSFGSFYLEIDGVNQAPRVRRVE